MSALYLPRLLQVVAAADMSCTAAGAAARPVLSRPGSGSSSTAGRSPAARRSQRPAEARAAEEDEDEPDDDDEASEAGEGDDGEESEDEDAATVDGDAAVCPDPRGTTTYMLPSLFLHRPATVWIDYPNFTGVRRTEGARPEPHPHPGPHADRRLSADPSPNPNPNPRRAYRGCCPTPSRSRSARLQPEPCA